MNFILLLTSFFFLTHPGHTINFGQQTGGDDWRALNDGVMGGLSQGTVSFSNESLIFKGAVSLENNGGFASVRSPYQTMDLSGFKKIKIRCKATGQNFAFTMENYQRWYMPYYKKSIDIPQGEWTTVEIELRDFDTYRVGQNMGEKPSDEMLAKVIRLGFVNTGKKSGDFQLEIDYIEFM
ncbi:MAG: CIA30 family protein [Bacteroidota bacterium]